MRMRKNFRHREQAGQRPRAVANKNLKRANVSGIYRVEDDGHLLHSLDWKKSFSFRKKLFMVGSGHVESAYC